MASEDVEAATKRNKNNPTIMPNLPKSLSLEEKKYLLAIERGDLANVRRMLQKANRLKSFDINCMDSLGRGALTIAIDQENLEMLELLVVMGIETKDALLHAINVEFVEAVELLLEHEELIHKEGELYSWQKVDINTAMFTPDITPLILAAHRNNYEILKILLDRGATVPMPHDIKCGCDECIRESEQDSLRHSLSRLNEYKALASPSLIALSSSDPLLTAFQLSWELRNLAFAEPETKSEYMELRKQCQQFAVDLLHQSRSSEELAIILNHDPESPPYEEGEHMKLARLELAIQFKQKKFVAHPNIQQLLASLWYEGVPGFRRKSSKQKVGIILKVAALFPFYCLLYVIAPETKTGKLMRKPFMKFLIHASSYLFFLFILILVSQRAEDQVIELFGPESLKKYVIQKYDKQRGNPPMVLEYVVFFYVIGFIVEETHEIMIEGMESYLRDLWNFIDFTRNFLYVLVFVLRGAAYIQQTSEIKDDPATAFIKRENWNAFDFQLIAEGLFAAANVFSALKLVHLFSINPHLGPLQISLGRMVIDIVKFFFIYTLVLFAFACGLNQLLWYFSDLEKKKCFHLPDGEPDFDNFGDACMKWRRFANVFESSQSLFWASFGMIDLSSFELTGIKTYTRFWGLLMFGSYSVINVIVLLNLLIAMMSNSYAMIDEHSDTEWKFARTKLWLSYFEESATLPPPFNIFPRPKNFLKLFGIRKKDKLRRMSKIKSEEKERDYRYTAVMRALVWRYVSAMHRKMEESAVTEDDINELKSDISAFRYELLEVLDKNGMDISSAEMKEKAVLGKKMKIWERRLMKDFKVAPVTIEDENPIVFEAPPPGENSLARFRRIARMVAMSSNLNKWRQVVAGACIASQIGHCHSRESFKKQQNLQKAMDEARRLKAKTPSEISRVTTPIDLPDMTGSNIVNLIRDGNSDIIKFKSILTPDITNTVSPNIFISEATPTPSIKETSSLQTPADINDLINLQSTKTSPLLSKVRSVSQDDLKEHFVNDSDSNDNPYDISNDVIESTDEKNKSDKDSTPRSFTPDSTCSETNFPGEVHEYLGSTTKSDSFDRISVKDHIGIIEDRIRSNSPVFRDAKTPIDDRPNISFESPVISPTNYVTNESEDKFKDAPICEATDEIQSFADGPITSSERWAEEHESNKEIEESEVVKTIPYIDESNELIEQPIIHDEAKKTETPESKGVIQEETEILKHNEEVNSTVKDQDGTVVQVEQEVAGSKTATPPILVPEEPRSSSRLSVAKEHDVLSSRTPSPMTSRNIQRVGERKRAQPKYGWL